MELIWTFVNKTELKDASKRRLFLFLTTAVFALLGFLVWLVVRQHAFGNWAWSICFAGYPGVFFGYLGGAFFLFKKYERRNGRLWDIRIF